MRNQVTRTLTAIILICIMFSVISLSGCSSKKDSTIVESTAELPDLGFTDMQNGITMLVNRNNDRYINQSDMDIWEEYIQDKYNIDFDAINIISKDNIINTESIMESSNLHGFIYLNSRAELQKLIEMGYVTPINEYIGEIEVFATADSMTFSGFTDSNGDIWAFPVEFTPSSSMRYYNKEWLLKAGMEVPQTIDEVYEFAKFVAHEDPDGNGISDTFFAEFSVERILQHFGDIFRAFGCYSYDTSPIAYNPLKEKIEHSVYNENFVEAMNFIMLMYDEELIIKNDNLTANIIDTPRSYKVASTVVVNYKEVNESFNGWDFGHFITGINERNLIELEGSKKCLAVLKRTEDVAVKVNNLANALTGNQLSFFDFYVGMEGAQYDIVEGNFELREDRNKMVGLTFMLNHMIFNDSNAYNDVGQITDEIKSSLEYKDMRKYSRADAWQYYDSDVSYMLPLSAVSVEFNNLSRSIISDTQRLLWNCVKKEISIAEAIQVYQTQMDLKGTQRRIDELNGE